MRKIIIGLVAVGVVASLFWGYARFMDTTPIEVRDVPGLKDPDMPGSGDDAQRTGGPDAGIARYTVLDPETKKVIRVFGFEKLLNPGKESSRWRVEKPFMIFYESDYECHVQSDAGVLQVEGSGSNPVPKDAQLDGNVKIHITPKPGSRMSETTVKMDDLVFSSERSEFATDGKVDIESDQMKLKGLGLTVIFDAAGGRLDHLEIRDLEELRLYGLVDSKSQSKPETSPDAGSDRVASAPPPAETAVPSEKNARTQDESRPSPRYYQCILEDNVEIKYGDEYVVTGAEQVNIKNILFSKSSQGIQTADAPKRAEDGLKEAAKPNKPSGRPTETTPVEPSAEVIVTCNRGIVIKPMPAEATGPSSVTRSVFLAKMTAEPSWPVPRTTKKASGIGVNGDMNLITARPESLAFSPVVRAVNLTGPATHTTGESESDVASTEAFPTRFEARQIDYDLLTGFGLAHGPVRFTFYLPSDPNSAAAEPRVPVVITADQDAAFNADASRTINEVVFNENVLAERRSPQAGFTQVDHLHGNKLTVSLDENAEGKTDISRITMTEGKVYVQSQKLKDEQVVSNVKLYCSEIAYDRTDDQVVAKGPGGRIEMDNSHLTEAAVSEKSDGVDFSRPCFVYIDGFNEIQWNLTEQKIVADGQQDQLLLAYVPLVDGKPEKFISVNSLRFDLDFAVDSAGKTVLKRVFTDKPITYEEWNGDRTKRMHHIAGQKLDYDTADGAGWVKIEGTPAVPCNVDGSRMPYVYVHPVTGEVKASISTTPGVFQGR